MTRDSLLKFLDERLGVDTTSLTDDTPLFSGGVLDSFSMVDLIAFIESEVGARMSPGDVRLDHLDSVERILRFAESCKTGETSS